MYIKGFVYNIVNNITYIITYDYILYVLIVCKNSFLHYVLCAIITSHIYVYVYVNSFGSLLEILN